MFIFLLTNFLLQLFNFYTFTHLKRAVFMMVSLHIFFVLLYDSLNIFSYFSFEISLITFSIFSFNFLCINSSNFCNL